MGKFLYAVPFLSEARGALGGDSEAVCLHKNAAAVFLLFFTENDPPAQAVFEKVLFLF